MTTAAPALHSTFPVDEAKVRPPTRRRTTIDRARLLDILTDQGGPRVVALIAPPGYGKTTLLAQWFERESRPVAWLTLDDLDNDPAILLSYLAAALDRIGPIDEALRAAIAAPRQRILATAVPRLASELHRWGHSAVLILDDSHRLVDRTALDALAALLDHLPSSLRVAIAGRSEPDLQLARLRAAGDLVDLDTRLLSLDEQETAQVVAAEGYPLTPEEIRTLAVRTEGWVAGLHLAALALARGEPQAQVMSTFSGRDRYIADYLRSEFERDLAQDDTAVLARTAILETVTPPLAEAVAGVEGAWQRIAAVARTNLFVQEVGADGDAYRYHTLLRDFLQGELDRREPGTRADLHRRAAAWYLTARDLDRSVEHALASGDADLAARFVTAAALPMYLGGHPGTLERWLQQFDVAAIERHPPLAVIAGWIHLLGGRAEAADRLADVAERSTFEGVPEDGSASFESQRAMLRAMMVRHGPHDALANALAAAAAERVGSPWRSTALGVVGAAHRMLGRMDEAAVAFAQGRATGNMACAAMEAKIAMEKGDWAEAEAAAGKARALLTTYHFEELLHSLLVYAVSAHIAARRGDVARAREHLVKAQLRRPLASHAAPWLAVEALLEIARAYLAVSDPAGAQVAIREAEQVVRRRPALGVLTTELVELRRRLAEATATLAGSSTLTAAELRLLPLLPTYLSFQEIADRLGVSRNTVKTQAMAIYGKLQASSRGETVERAVELGLLEPFPGLEPAQSAPIG